MRDRKDIEKDYVDWINDGRMSLEGIDRAVNRLSFEVLLDIRELLQKKTRKTLTTEVTLTPAEQALYAKLDELHGN